MSEASVAANVLNSLQHLCRICLHQLGEIEIFGEPMLDSTISLCLDILVLNNDGGPQSICSDCKDKLDGIMIFRLIGERSKRQLELFLGRFEEYYTAQVPNAESVECQPDVTTIALHTNDLPNDLMDTSDFQGSPILSDSLKELGLEQINSELLETNTEQSPSPLLVKQETDSEGSSSVIQKNSAEYPIIVASSSVSNSSISNMLNDSCIEYNNVPTMKISVRTDLISNQNGCSNIPPGLNNILPSTSGVSNERVLLKAKTENSVEVSEHKFAVPKTSVKKNMIPVFSNGIELVKKEEAGFSKIIKQRSRRTSVEPCPPPICEICNKQFASRTSLYLHNRLHTQEKAHICPQCNKIFSSSTELSRHIRVHTGEKPYTCAICEKSFTQKVSLRKHQEKLHPVQKFEDGMLKSEMGDFNSGLVNQLNLNPSNYVGGLTNPPDFNAGEYIGGLMNQPDFSGENLDILVNRQGIGPSGLVNQPNIRASKYDSAAVNEPDIGSSEYASGLVIQPNIRAGEFNSGLMNQPAIVAGKHAISSVNDAMVAEMKTEIYH